MTRGILLTLAATGLVWGASPAQAQQQGTGFQAQRGLDQPQQRQQAQQQRFDEFQQPQQQRFDEYRTEERIEEYRARPQFDDPRAQQQPYDDFQAQQRLRPDFDEQRDRDRMDVDRMDRRAIQAEIDDVVSRYRWHDGTWWFIMRDGRRVFWDGTRWVDPQTADMGYHQAGQFRGQYGTGFRGYGFPQQTYTSYYTPGWGGYGGWGGQYGWPQQRWTTGYWDQPGWGGGWGHGGWGGGWGHGGALRGAVGTGLVGAGIGGLAGGRRGARLGLGIGAGVGALRGGMW